MSAHIPPDPPPPRSPGWFPRFCATIVEAVAHQRGGHRDELSGGATNPLSQCHPDGSRCPISAWIWRSVWCLVTWSIALGATLSIASWPGDWGHGVCGPWGCGPPLQALVACHAAWLVVLFPPTLWIRMRGSFALCRRIGWLVLAAGVLGILGLSLRESLTWLSHSDELHRSYWPQRIGFVLITLVDVPLVQLALAGVALLTKRGDRSRPFIAP